MVDETTKPCTRCREPIPLGATRCAKCQSWQSFGAYCRGSPQVWLGLLSTCVLLPFVFLPLYWLRFDRGKEFAKYRDQIEVLDSQLRISGDGTEVVTVGRLRNNSLVTWTDVAIEVQYFDREGKLAGAKSARDHDLVLLPGSDSAFQVSSLAEGAIEVYASQKVFIRDAHDAQEWP